jgi:cytochrome c-type protein NapB
MMRERIMGVSCLGLVIAAIVFQGCSTGTPDAEIGLSKTSVFDTPSPAAVEVNQTMPGENPVHPRANAVEPPVIPHGIGDFLPITAGDNMCVACHAIDVKEEGSPTPIPESHYVDYRNSPDQVGDELAGARYNCVACHVSLTTTTPLVPNTYED